MYSSIVTIGDINGGSVELGDRVSGLELNGSGEVGYRLIILTKLK